MNFFDWDDPNSDAAMFGGIAGFVEESIKSEDEVLQETDIDLEDSDIEDNNIASDRQLQVLKATKPALFEYITNKVIENKRKTKKWLDEREEERRTLQRLEEAKEEFWYELEYIKEDY